MKQLSPNWFVEGLPDFEFQKYRLLSYLKEVNHNFSKTRLFPFLSDLVGHYRTLSEYQQRKSDMKGRFPRDLVGLDLKKKELIFDQEEGPEREIGEIDLIVNYSLPRIKQHLDEGKEIYEFIENQIEIQTVGLTPLYRDEGYLLLQSGPLREVKAFEYQMSIYTHAEENFRSLRIGYLDKYPIGPASTPESIKLELVRSHHKYPNPATYFVHSPFLFPEKQTLMPVVKRKFIRWMSNVA